MLFGGVDLSPYLRIKKIYGRGMIKNELQIKTFPGMDGGRYQRKRRPIRVLTVEADIKSSGDEELRDKIDELNRILNVEKPVSIIFPDEPDREYFGIPEVSEEDDDFIFYHKGSLIIVCPDSNKYGDEDTEISNTGTLTINNPGSAKTFPVIDLTFNSTQSSVAITNGDKTLELIYDFVAGDEVSIDMKVKKVTLNGVVNNAIISLNNPHFFPLNLGDNTITITPAVDAVVTYREAWA